jgi:hypothetical protein
MKKRRQIFKVKYCINYDSGKKWTNTEEVAALSELGAISLIKWQRSSYDVSIISVTSLGYVSSEIYKERRTLGDF